MILTVLEDIKKHAELEYKVAGRECCGLIIVANGVQKYIPCDNKAEKIDDFRISKQDQAYARDQGEVIAVVHSHPYTSPEPTPADLASCEESKLPWVIINYPTFEYRVVEPSGFELPYVGREFVYGVSDCYTLVRDYYKRELGLVLPEHGRPEKWWVKGMNLYMENYEAAGFVKAEMPLQKHDGLLLQLRSPVPNHAAIYLGDGKILHHVYGKLSTIDMYDGYWSYNTVIAVRYPGL